MLYLNEMEIDTLVDRARRHSFPNYTAAVSTLSNLRDQANSMSDGWPYWQKPARSAKQLMSILAPFAGYVGQELDSDLDIKEVRKAFTPIKSFLTRYNIPHESVIVNP